MPINLVLKQQILIANNGKVKTKRPKKWLYPMQAERVYERQLVEINKIFSDKVKEKIYPTLDYLVALSKAIRPDSEEKRLDYSWVDTMKQLTEATYLDFTKIVSPQMVTVISQQQAERISVLNKAEFVKVIHSAVAVNPIVAEPHLEQHMKAFQSQNTALITKLGTEQRDRLESSLYTNLSAGHGADKIKEDLIKNEGIGERRARLIARDQTNKFNGQLTEMRQLEIGIGSYIWTTARDERVRPTHKAHEGKLYEWNKPPLDTGHPGNDIRCRCIAQPVITDDMFDSDLPINSIASEPNLVEEIESTVKPSIVGFAEKSKLSTLKYSSDFSKEELDGLKEYQNGVYNSKVGGYTNIQSYLRSNKPAFDGISLDGVQGYVEKIDKAILKGKLVEDTISYRGIKHGQFYIDLEKGKIFNDKGYFSTSTNKNLAAKFADKLNRDERPVLFKVVGAKGTNAVYMTDLGKSKESEILFKREQQFEIINKKDKGKYWEIEIKSKN